MANLRVNASRNQECQTSIYSLVGNCAPEVDVVDWLEHVQFQIENKAAHFLI